MTRSDTGPRRRKSSEMLPRSIQSKKRRPTNISRKAMHRGRAPMSMSKNNRLKKSACCFLTANVKAQFRIDFLKNILDSDRNTIHVPVFLPCISLNLDLAKLYVE